MSREHVVSRVPVVIIHVVIFVNVRLTVVSRALHNVDSFEGPYLVPSMGAVLRWRDACGMKCVASSVCFE